MSAPTGYRKPPLTAWEQQQQDLDALAGFHTFLPDRWRKEAEDALQRIRQRISAHAPRMQLERQVASDHASKRLASKAHHLQMAPKRKSESLKQSQSQSQSQGQSQDAGRSGAAPNM